MLILKTWVFAKKETLIRDISFSGHSKLVLDRTKLKRSFWRRRIWKLPRQTVFSYYVPTEEYTNVYNCTIIYTIIFSIQKYVDLTTFLRKTRQKNGFPFFYIIVYRTCTVPHCTSLSLLSYAQLGQTFKQTVKSLNDNQCDSEFLYSQGEILCFLL